MVITSLDPKPSFPIIVNLESRLRHTANGGNIPLTSEQAIGKIKNEIEGTLDKGTAMYGLRALSRLGVSLYTLLELADNYNGRVHAKTGWGGIFSARNPPLMEYFNVEYIPEHIDIIDIKDLKERLLHKKYF